MTKTAKASGPPKLLAAPILGVPYFGRLALVGAAVAVLFALVFAYSTPTGPVSEHYGTVSQLGFAESEHGSRPYAMVRVRDRNVRVSLFAGGLCRVGDRILIRRQKMLLSGYRYRASPAGCTRPA